MRAVPSPADGIVIRAAGPDDIPALVALMRDFHGEAGYTLDEDAAAQAFARLLSSPSLGGVWLAERADTPLGHVVLCTRFSMDHGMAGCIDDLYVVPAERGQGIARRLLDALAAASRQMGCGALQVEVAADNVPALAVYRRAGLAPHADGRLLLAGPLARE